MIFCRNFSEPWDQISRLHCSLAHLQVLILIRSLSCFLLPFINDFHSPSSLPLLHGLMLQLIESMWGCLCCWWMDDKSVEAPLTKASNEQKKMKKISTLMINDKQLRWKRNLKHIFVEFIEHGKVLLSNICFARNEKFSSEHVKRIRVEWGFWACFKEITFVK